jgi:hypothetical protein
MKQNSRHIAVKTNLSPDEYTEFSAECSIEGETHAEMIRRLMKSYTKSQKDKREAGKRERTNLVPVWALQFPGKSNYAMQMRSHQ